MNIIDPSVEYIPCGDYVQHVATCARVCYGKKKSNDKALYERLIKDGHWSMFRHATYYAIIKRPHLALTYPEKYIEDVYNNTFKVVGLEVKRDSDRYYIAYNGNFALDHPHFHETLRNYHVSQHTFEIVNPKVTRDMVRHTFKVVTQISTSRELNRTSPNNISEQSTRYVDLKNGTICRPHWLTKELYPCFKSYLETKEEIQLQSYLSICERCFKHYSSLIEEGMKKEDARGVLPLDTATVCVYTYSKKEWEHIITLRGNKRAHPNAQIIANMIKDKLAELTQNT